MISKKSKIWKVLLTARIGLTILSNSLWQTVEAMNWSLPSAEYIWDRQTVVAVDYNSWTGLCQTKDNNFDLFWTELVPCWSVDNIIDAVKRWIINWKQITSLDPSETIHSSDDNQDWILYYQESTNKTYVSTRQQQLNQGVERYFDANWQVTTFEFSLMLTRQFSPSSIWSLGESVWARNYMKQISWIDFLTSQTRNQPMTRETAIVLLMKAAWANFSPDELNFYNNNWSNLIWDRKTNTAYNDILKKDYPKDSLYIKLATDLYIVWWLSRVDANWNSQSTRNLNFNPSWNMTRREFTKIMMNTFKQDIPRSQTTLLKGLNYTKSSSTSNTVISINWITYWQYADSAQITVNNNTQKITDFIDKNNLLVFNDFDKTWIFMTNYNLLLKQYSNSISTPDPLNILISLNYSNPKYFDSSISLSWQNPSYQSVITIWSTKINVWSKFEFEKVLEWYRTYAESTPQGINVLRTWKQLTYAEIYLFSNSYLGWSTNYSTFVYIETVYNLLPNYSILY